MLVLFIWLIKFIYNTILYLIDMSQQQQQEAVIQTADLRVEGIPIDDLPFDKNESNWDRTWYDKYGLLTKNLFAHSVAGQTYDDRRFKGIFIDNKYRRIVSRYLTLYPNQEVQAYLDDNAKKLQLELKKTYYSHYGDAQYWELLSTEIDDYVEYADRHDVVKVGAVVRNSVGTNVALGADLFTWRLFCENGAVARGRDMGFALRHVGDPEKLFATFEKELGKIVQKSLGLVEYYKKAAKLRINKRIAAELAKRIPVRALPDCISYDYKTHTPILGREDDLWRVFNDITEKVWHPERFHHKDTGFSNKSTIEKQAHWVLINAVQGRYNQ